MASVYYGQNRGDADAQPFVVQEGSSTNSTDFELRIDTGKGSTRADVRRAVENILHFFESGLNTTFPL